MIEEKKIKGKTYRIISLLGHGKGGYSYLAECEGVRVVVKQIHHEPCDYYSFGNKIKSELNDYDRLKKAGIRIPEMFSYDEEEEVIVKEYIEGDTVLQRIINGESVVEYLPQIMEMAGKAMAAGLNIDFFPSNFVIRDGLLWYVDYECNGYMEEWNFENWGRKYWSMTPELKEYLADRSR